MILLIDNSAKTCYVSPDWKLFMVELQKNYIIHFLRKICSQDYKIYRVFSGATSVFNLCMLFMSVATQKV